MSAGFLGEAYIAIRATDDQLMADINRAKGAIQSTILTTSRSTVSGLTNVAGGILAAIGVQRILGFFKNLVLASLSTNAQLEQMSISFEVMLGNAAKANRLIGNLRNFAASTPFQLSSLTSGAAALLGTKEVAENEVIPILRKLGDAAAGSADGFASFPRIIRAITQMMGKTKIAGQEMLQLTEAGVPAWSILAKKMGLSTAEVQKLGEKGKLGMSEIFTLVDALGENFEGLAAKQAKGFFGLASTIRDQVGKALADIGKPLFEFSKLNLTNLVDWMSSDDAQAWIKLMTGGLTKVVDLVKSGLGNPVVQAVGKFFLMAGGVTTVLLGLVAIKAAVVAIATFLAPIVAPLLAIGAVVGVIAASLRSAFNSEQGEKLKSTLVEIKDLAVEVFLNLKDIFSELFTFLAAQWTKLFGSSIQNVNASFWESILSGVRDVMDIVSLLTTNWRLAWELMQTGAKLQLVRVRDAIVGFWEDFKGLSIGFFGGIFSLLDKFVDKWKEILKAIGNLATAQFRGIAGALKVALSGGSLSDIAAAATKPMTDAINALVNQGGDLGKAFSDGFSSSFSGFGDHVSPEQRRLRNALNDLAGQLAKDREQRRKDREKPIDTSKDPSKIALDEEKKKKEEAKKLKLKIEFVSLSELGRGIQTALGKATKENRDKKMADDIGQIAKDGKDQTALQKKQLDATVDVVDGIKGIGFHTA